MRLKDFWRSEIMKKTTADAAATVAILQQRLTEWSTTMKIDTHAGNAPRSRPHGQRADDQYQLGLVAQDWNTPKGKESKYKSSKPNFGFKKTGPRDQTSEDVKIAKNLDKGNQNWYRKPEGGYQVKDSKPRIQDVVSTG